MSAQSRNEPSECIISQNKLEEFLQQKGYSLSQKNAQRITCSSQLADGATTKGYEVFIGKLPHDATEVELLPHFEKVGRIRCLRLMVDYRGQNRGFGFIIYEDSEAAQRAVRELNRSFLRPHRRIAVVSSVDNRRLFIGGLPPTVVADDILQEISQRVANVESVILYPSAADPSRNRGFAFIEFKSHMAAAIARKQLQNCVGEPMFSRFAEAHPSVNNIQVDWASPEPQIDPQKMAKVTNLFVRNVSTEASESELTKLFSLDGQLEVIRVRRPSNFAFVHFAQREHAQRALERLNGSQLHGLRLEVEWAKPPPKYQSDRVHDGYRSRPLRAPKFQQREYYRSPHNKRSYFETSEVRAIGPPLQTTANFRVNPAQPHIMAASHYYRLFNSLCYQLFGEGPTFNVMTYFTPDNMKLFYVYVNYGNYSELFDYLYEDRQCAVEAAAFNCYNKLQAELYHTHRVGMNQGVDQSLLHSTQDSSSL